MITVACVYTGTKYSLKYVDILRNMVSRNISVPWRFVVLTDREYEFEDSEIILVSKELPGWWAKMALFNIGWRLGSRMLYFDLDTVVFDSIDPLAALEHDFCICKSFTRSSVNIDWPCAYGSCCMVFGPDYGYEIWRTFKENRKELMNMAGHYGDQRVIEELIPDAPLLQDLLPGFFLGYRELPKYPNAPPPEASVLVFAGKHKPHNTNIKWVKEQWR